MRLFTTTIAIAALLLTSAAGAAEGEKGAAPAPAPAPTDNGQTGGKTGDDIPFNIETHDARNADTKPSAKVWEVAAGIEYHRMIISEDVANGANINVVTYSLSGRWDITPYDRLRISGGVYEPFLIDSGDSAARLDDIALSYTRRIPLPGEVTLRATASVTAPTSYASQLNGIYTQPRVSLQLSRTFGHLSLDFRVGAGGFIAGEAAGGSDYNGGGNSGFGVGNNGGGANPNPKAAVSGTLSAEFSMPFHDKLSIGALAYTGYVWFYDVSNGPCPANEPYYMESTVCMYGSENTVYNQPIAQSYGFEVHANYALPTVAGIKSDLGFAFAPLGDSVVGYKSVLGGTGLVNLYGMYRENAEVYFSFGARY